ncbi:MAG: hypothetical protein K0S39_5581 [Paenibacillus sp.]|nr:hypothetical protein [Paenibacillus sp.]
MNSIKNEWVHIISGKYMILVIVVPLIVALVFGFTFSKNQIKETRIAVIDEDNSFYSRQLINKIEASQYVQIQNVFNHSVNPDMLLYNEKHYAVLYLPKGLEQNKYTGKPSNIGLFIDNSVPATAVSPLTGIQEVILGENAAGGSASAIAVQQRLLYNPLGETIGNAPLSMMNLVFLAVMSTGPLAIVSRLRVEGLYTGETANPFTIFSRIIPYAFIGAISLQFALSLLKQIGGLRFNVNPVEFFLPLLLYTLTSCLLALVLGWTAEHPGKASGRVLFLVLPNMLLAGVQAPVAMLHDSLQYFSNLFPLTWFFKIVRGMGMRGGELEYFYAEMGVLILLCCVLLTIGSLLYFKDIRRMNRAKDQPEDAAPVVNSSAAINQQT